MFLHLEKMEFLPGSPIGTTTINGEVKLYSDPGQLSFVKINLKIERRLFKCECSFNKKIINSGPLILYYLSISEIDTHF